MTSALSTDLYELTMAVSYLRRRMRAAATFSLAVRRLPPQRGFLVCAGLSDCLDFLSAFRFTDDELGYVGDLLKLPDRDLQQLGALRFTGDVWAVPEGHVVSGGTPLLELTAPLPQAQLVETALLNFVTFQTTVASKAARCRLAAPHAQLIDFGMRRTQSLQAAMQVARASAIAGFDATSNVAAARQYGLVASGTMAHSYVEAFPSEREAFRAFAADFPSRAVFLVDTYDTLAGTGIAAEVARAGGLGTNAGIRLDSGDLAELAFGARRILDAAGLPAVRIVASGGLDEHALDSLVRAGAPIDAYGVGTKLGTSADAPYLDTAYKLVEYDRNPVFKLSPGKQTMPGRKQVFRGPGLLDRVGTRDQVPPAGTRPLLQEVMRGGERVLSDSLAAARARCAADLAELPDIHRRLREPVPSFAECTPELLALAQRVGALAPDPSS